MSWDTFVGHDLVKDYLRSSIDKDRVSHAYSFIGPQGVGKATVARVFAQALLCRTGVQGEPCGACRICDRIDRRIHPDVRWVVPQDGTLRIEQIRELQSALALKAFEADRKVAIIDDADTMTTAAQNCLLKLLEEPPGETVIMLIAINPSALLPTIRSRCQLLRFQPLPLAWVTAHLVARGVDSHQAQLIAAMTEGRLGAALAAVENDMVAVRDEVAAWVGELSGGDREGLRSVIHIGQRMEKERERVEDYLNIFLLWLRDLLLLQEGAGEAIANQDAMGRLDVQSTRMGLEKLAAAMRAVDGARRRLRGNANFRLTIDVMLTAVQRSLASP